jgi:hypothetical protein
VAAIVASLLAGCGGRGAAPAPTPSRTAAATTTPAAGPRLLVVGDSLAFGRFANTQADAFAQLVAAATHARLRVIAAPV